MTEFRGKKIKTAIFSHKKGGKYSIIEIAEMKYNGEWFPAVIYKDVISGKVYVRTEQSFEESFNLVGDE